MNWKRGRFCPDKEIIAESSSSNCRIYLIQDWRDRENRKDREDREDHYQTQSTDIGITCAGELELDIDDNNFINSGMDSVNQSWKPVAAELYPATGICVILLRPGNMPAWVLMAVAAT